MKTYDAWDQLGLIVVVAALLLLAAALVVISIKQTQPKNRYRREVLPNPQPNAVGPRHYADT